MDGLDLDLDYEGVGGSDATVLGRPLLCAPSTPRPRTLRRSLHALVLSATVATLAVSSANLLCYSHVRWSARVDGDTVPGWVGGITQTCRASLRLFGGGRGGERRLGAGSAGPDGRGYGDDDGLDLILNLVRPVRRGLQASSMGIVFTGGSGGSRGDDAEHVGDGGCGGSGAHEKDGDGCAQHTDEGGHDHGGSGQDHDGEGGEGGREGSGGHGGSSEGSTGGSSGGSTEGKQHGHGGGGEQHGHGGGGGGGHHGHGHGHGGSDTKALLLQGFALPLLAVSCLTYLVSRDSELFEPKRVGPRAPEVLLAGPSPRFLLARTFLSRTVVAPARWLWRRIGPQGGDPNVTGWTLLIAGLPAALIALVPQTQPMDAHPQLQDMPTLAARVYLLANPAGIAAVAALALFLIPVARHSPLLKVFGLSHTQALAFHRTSGWISLAFTLLHSLIYCAVYGLRGGDGQSFWKAMASALYPPSDCWSWDVLRVRGTSSNFSCQGYWRNFTGVVSALAFTVLGVTSLPRVRRAAYRLFYVVHIPMAWTMMIMAIAHFSFVALFLVPNIVYYLGTTVPVWVSQLLSSRRDGGCRVRSVAPIEGSAGCYLVRFPYRRGRRRPSEGNGDPGDAEETKYGGVCKVCVPEISAVWHPFSVMVDPKDPEYLLFLIRGVGPFTKAWLHRMLASSKAAAPTVDEENHRNEQHGNGGVDGDARGDSSLPPTPPVVLLDGLYPAEYRWHRNSLSHDTVLLVAGGVGIVPFLPLLSELRESVVLCHKLRQPSFRLRRVVLHWYCREEGLAKFICQKYLNLFLLDTGGNATLSNSGQGTANGSDNDIERDPTASYDTFSGEHPEAEEEEDRVDNGRVTFEIFVHVTSRRNEESSVSSSELADEILHSGNRNSSPTIILCNENVADKEREVLSDSYLSLQITLGDKISRFLWFGVISGVGLALHWWYYMHAIDSAMITIPRTYSVLIFLVIILFLGSGIAYQQRKRPSYQLLQRNIDDEGGDTASSSNDSSSDDEDATRQDVRYGPAPPSICKRLVISAGRPAPSEVVASVAEAKNPGALFCGPNRLRQSIKEEITKNQVTCAIYDEQSEM